MSGELPLFGFGSGGSGGRGLNFKVVGGLTQPSGPAENIIWVNTDVEITSWQLSGTEPTEPVEGMVWIATGKSGSTEINALKKNAILLHPLYAKQYISGQWVSKDVQVYQDGKWSALFSGLIYEAGTYYTEHTSYLLPDTAVVEDADGAVILSTVANKTSEAYKVFGPIPLDDINTLAMTSAFTDSISGAHRRVLYVAQSPGVGYADAALIETAEVSSKWTTEATITLDVSSLSGEYYVYAGTNTAGSAWDNVRKISITKVTGEDTAAETVSLSELDEAFNEGVNSV